MRQLITKFLVTMLLFTLCSNNIYSQTDSEYTHSNWCGTKASKNDIEFVRDLINTPLKSLKVVSDFTYFSVQHHIVRDGNGNNGLSPSVIPDIINYLNNAFYAAGVQFYSCNPTNFINSDLYYQLDSYSEELSLRNTHNNPDAINIYYFNPMINGYWAYTYQNGSVNFIGIRNEIAPNGTTIIHEMGHFFGLLHTFEGYSTPVTSSMELVTRGINKNCDVTGDFLCDTPADPFIGQSTVNTSCIYFGSAKDYNNEAYTPDVSNYMAYSMPSCRYNYSAGQISIISAMASNSGKQSFIHKTEIANNNNLDGHISDDFITVINSTVNSGANVVLEACQEIEIISNFEIIIGATFEAK